MSITQAELIEKIRFLSADNLPEAQWTLGNGLKSFTKYIPMLEYLKRYLPIVQLKHIAGAPPCLWNLDWHSQQRPTSYQLYAQALEVYAQRNVGFTLVLDNPFITEEELLDPYGHSLVDELYKRDRVRLNAVTVAHDGLLALIKQKYPKLPVYCHYNRLVAEHGRRTPALYNKLAQQYDRVCLHPADAPKASITTELEDKTRFSIIVNDPCLRADPVRREHMQLLADIRRAPYNHELLRLKDQLLERSGVRTISQGALQQKRSCNLTQAEKDSLYAQGFRHFIIEAAPFRNEHTVLAEIPHQFFTHTPEYSHLVATASNAFLSSFGNETQAIISSGLFPFTFTPTE